jgi:glycosyltransferase involved in cell wall biosynthesis
MRIHFITNGVFTTSIAGGDIHFLKLAEGAAEAGYTLNFLGGHALKEVIEKSGVPGVVTLTDDAPMPKVDQATLGGQIALFRDMLGRYRRTLQKLHLIEREDFVYAASDYWFDVLAAVKSPARRKLMVLHMEAPTLGQIITRGRPDVDPKRLASLHYWASQRWSLRRFCASTRRPMKPPRDPWENEKWRRELDRHPTTPPVVRKHLFYLHPLMEPRLKKLGVRDDERTLLSYGLEVAATDAVPAQQRVYDVVWIGRVHRQKGIDDLLDTLAALKQRLPGLRAMFIGNVRDALRPEVERRGLGTVVEFAGFVSEEEKIRLFKASRVFLMPSTHEGSPRVIGESIIAGTPVVAYDIPNYRPLFGEFARYAPPFDLPQFQRVAEREIAAMRASRNYLETMDLEVFKRDNSWDTTQRKFLDALAGLR